MDKDNLFMRKSKLLDFLSEPYYYIKSYFLLLLSQSLFFVAPDIQNLIHYVFIAWGCLVIFYQTIVYKRIPKIRILWIFGVSWILALLSILLNREAGNLIYSLKTWFLLCLVYMVFFPFFALTKKEKNEALIGIIRPLVVLQFVFALLSALLYFFNVSGYIFRSDTGFYWGVRYIFRDSGIINPLLIGVYNDANYVTLITFVSIVFSLVIYSYKETKKTMRAFLLLNILLESYLFILANSRAANLALAFAFLVWLILIIKNSKQGAGLAKQERIVLGIVLCISIFSLLLGSNIRRVSFLWLEKDITRVTVVMPGGTKSIDFKGPNIPEDKWTFFSRKGSLSDDFVGKYFVYFSESNLTEKKNSAEDAIEDDLSMRNKHHLFSEDKEDTSTSEIGDLGNGRIGRWMESIKLVSLHRPLTGTSPRGIQYFAQKYSSEGEPFRRLSEGQHTVSSVLTYLLYYGWPAFLFLVAFCLLIAWQILRYLIKKKTNSIEYILMTGLAVFLLIVSIFLSALLEVATYYSCTTLFVLGYLFFGRVEEVDG